MIGEMWPDLEKKLPISQYILYYLEIVLEFIKNLTMCATRLDKKYSIDLDGQISKI